MSCFAPGFSLSKAFEADTLVDGNKITVDLYLGLIKNATKVDTTRARTPIIINCLRHR